MVVLKLLYQLYLKQETNFKPWRNWLTIAWQTLLFVSESLAIDKRVSPDLRWRQHVSGKQYWLILPGLYSMVKLRNK